MKGTITQYLANVMSERDRAFLRAVLAPIGDRLSTQALTNSTLVQSGTTTKVKTGAADSYFSVKGKLVKIAAATDMAVLSGVISDAKINVFCFYVDVAGNLTSAMGTEATALVDVVFPVTPEGKCLVGYVQITCSGGAFTGGSNDVATAGNFTVVFVSPTGAFDPSVLL